MWTQKFCLICIYILRNYAFQISNEALFLAFLQPVANWLKSFILPSNRMGKTSSASTFTHKPVKRPLPKLKYLKLGDFCFVVVVVFVL